MSSVGAALQRAHLLRVVVGGRQSCAAPTGLNKYIYNN